MSTTSAVLWGGPLDGRLLLRFPEGDWHARSDGWPLTLERDGSPVASQHRDEERYCPVEIQGERLIYVWAPVLPDWYLRRRSDA
ncbi:hypothetical protein WHI96_08015 [Pseudonocardia tropica]|uniref:Uncharacterized protein n=1 Tax=Pseudonocardia tropica TaxID=681289 RepID=A0ABV1JTM1_9PSEU